MNKSVPEENTLGDMSIDRRIILKYFVRKRGVRVWTGLK
jgi:hypothetical protein